MFPLLTAVLYLSSPVSASDKLCKGIKLKEDRFGGGLTATEVIQALGRLRAIGMHMEAKSGTVTLTVRVKESGALNGGVPAGSEIIFSLDDGTMLTLATARETSVQSYVSGDAVMTAVPYTFVLSPDQLETFSTSELDAARVPVISTGTTFDWSASGKVRKKLLSTAACMRSL
ncbi:MAG: hypothetical protein GXP62_01295 [Oligoflexia bacterium]|nr:hypothetical protein [Oligoflexia bacterium]